jgi:hypothetical protein
VQRGVPIVVELKCADRRQTGIVNGMLTVTDEDGVQVLVRRSWGYFDTMSNASCACAWA